MALQTFLHGATALLGLVTLSPLVASQAAHCNHTDTGLYIYNTPHCTFFRCDGGQQLRLKCTRSPNAANGGNNAHIRSVLQTYTNWAKSTGETPLFLEVYGTTAYYNNNGHVSARDSFDSALVGSAGELIHKLIIHTDYLSLVPRTVWKSMPNLKILELKVVYADVFTANYFADAHALESLLVNTGTTVLTLEPAIFNLPSLTCLQLEGTGFRCDCTMMDFIRRSPLWRLTDSYENPLMDDDVRECGVHSAARCGPPIFVGSALDAFNFIDCPQVPPSAALTGNPALYGSSSSCDFENLRIKLKNLGRVADLNLNLNGDPRPECQPIIKHGVVNFDVRHNQCGTVTSANNITQQITLSNNVHITKTLGDETSEEIDHDYAQSLAAILIPVSCKLSYGGKLSQNVPAPPIIYPSVSWVGQVRVKMDILPHTSVLGQYTFDIALDSAHYGEWSMSVENCWATPTVNEKDAQRYDIIKNGCFKDRSLRVQKQGGNQWSRQTFTVNPFQFKGTSKAEVYIHCDVQPCSTLAHQCKLKQTELCRGPTTEAPTSTSQAVQLTTEDTTTDVAEPLPGTVQDFRNVAAKKLSLDAETGTNLGDAALKMQPKELSQLIAGKISSR